MAHIFDWSPVKKTNKPRRKSVIQFFNSSIFIPLQLKSSIYLIIFLLFTLFNGNGSYRRKKNCTLIHLLHFYLLLFYIKLCWWPNSHFDRKINFQCNVFAKKIVCSICHSLPLSLYDLTNDSHEWFYFTTNVRESNFLFFLFKRDDII